ncbi:MAG TPA: hypothetical protein VFF66_11395 [Brevundimonas sp.]|nr:hypothetical protein [Brevundimonas sp.]
MLVLTALTLCGFADPGAARSSGARPQAAVVVVTLDDARQGQIKHGRSVIAALDGKRLGRVEVIEPTVPTDDFRACEDDTPEYGLAFCVRFYLSRSAAPESPPHVVVAFTDREQSVSQERGRGDMRALCFGRGAEPADAQAQDIWLWTDSARVHGINDWERDKDALAACIEAALSEAPGEPRPRPL